VKVLSNQNGIELGASDWDIAYPGH